jgi:hypothetical protein
MAVAVAVLSEIWQSERETRKRRKMWHSVVAIGSGGGGIEWVVAVAGWQWYRWIEEIKAVILILVPSCGCGCGGGWVAVKIWKKKLKIPMVWVINCWRWVNGWQWLGGSGVIGKRRSVRFEWW